MYSAKPRDLLPDVAEGISPASPGSFRDRPEEACRVGAAACAAPHISRLFSAKTSHWRLAALRSVLGLVESLHD